jgi:hypothetical protein
MNTSLLDSFAYAVIIMLLLILIIRSARRRRPEKEVAQVKREKGEMRRFRLEYLFPI